MFSNLNNHKHIVVYKSLSSHLQLHLSTFLFSDHGKLNRKQQWNFLLDTQLDQTYIYSLISKKPTNFICKSILKILRKCSLQSLINFFSTCSWWSRLNCRLNLLVADNWTVVSNCGNFCILSTLFSSERTHEYVSLASLCKCSTFPFSNFQTIVQDSV